MINKMINWEKLIITALLVLPLIMLSGLGDAHATEKNPCGKNPCAMKNPCGAANPCAVASVLECPENVKSEACSHNKEGISHFKQGHWDVAAKHFADAVKADPNFAEAHYNLELSLHKQGKHEEATDHLKTAAKLAPNNDMIQKSEILKQHIGKNPCGMKNPCAAKNPCGMKNPCERK